MWEATPRCKAAWEWAVDGCDAVINLVGQNLFGQRWSPEIKRKIRDSRVYATEYVVKAVESASIRPKVFVQGSAVGYYGPHGDEELTEESPSGTDFLGVVCREWEEASAPAGDLGCRLAIVRTGIVLSRGDGRWGRWNLFSSGCRAERHLWAVAGVSFARRGGISG